MACARQDDRLRADPPHTPHAAIRSGTAERHANRDRAARRAAWWKENGKEFADDVGRKLADCEVEAIKAQGFTSANAIAAELNRREITKPGRGKWTAQFVLKVLARL